MKEKQAILIAAITGAKWLFKKDASVTYSLKKNAHNTTPIYEKDYTNYISCCRLLCHIFIHLAI
jgi:hypothetical protein